MVLSERDPNSGGRDSRASHLSGSQKNASTIMSSQGNDVFSPGSSVLGMLKTTTETGDIGSFSLNPGRLPKPARPPARPRQGSSTVAPSRTSSHYSRNGSLHSRISDHTQAVPERPMPGTWPSHIQDSTFDLPQPRPLGPAMARGGLRALALTASEYTEQDQRSYSLTNAIDPSRHLSSNKSISSLNSYGHRSHSASPYQQQPRLRRPNPRPASPALSDTVGVVYRKPPIARPPPGARAYSTSPVPPQRAYMTNGNGRIRHPPSMGETSRHMEMRPPVMPGPTPVQPTFMPAPNPHRAPQPLPLLVNTPTPRVSAQQWRAFPSPLSQNQTIDHQRPQIPRPPPSRNTPYVGFVARVKNILEERASNEEMNRKKNVGPTRKRPQMDAREESQRAELSASPVAKRLTRDLIKAAIDTCSDADQPTSPGGFETVVSSVPDELPPYDATATHPSQAIPPAALSTGADTYAPESSASEMTTQQSSLDAYSHAMAFTQPGSPLKVDSTESDQSEEQPSESTPAELPEHSVQQESDYSPPLRNMNKFASVPPTPYQKTADVVLTRNSLPDSKELSGRPIADLPGPGKELAYGDDYSESDLVSSADGMQSHSMDSAVSSLRTQSRRTMARSSPDQDHPPLKVQRSPIVGTSPSRQTTASSAVDMNVKPRATAPTPAPSVARSSLRSSVGAEKQEAGMIPSWNTSTTDLRLSAMKQYHFPLPDLTEDSQEDASTTNLRMLGAKPPAFRHSGQKLPKPCSRPVSRHILATEQPKTYLSATSANAHGIPSLEFSNADLTTTLNQALGLRTSRSLEEVRTLLPKSVDVSPLEAERPASSNSHRERYKSFFLQTEGDGNGSDHEAESEESEDQHATVLNAPGEVKRSLDEEIITELKRLSIPSVSGLTMRLSELIPTIQKGSSALDITKSEENVTSTLSEIRELGSPERLASMDLSRASSTSSKNLGLPTRKFTVQSSKSAPESKSYADRTTCRLDKDLPSLPPEATQSRASITSAPSALPIAKEYENRSGEIAELEATVPAKPATKTSQITRQASSPRKYKLKRPSNRTLRTVTPDGRPWNKESNYTWGADAPAMQIKLPDPSVRDNGSPAPRGRHRIKASRSTDFLPDHDIRIARTMSPGPNMESTLWPRCDEAEEEIHAQRRGILGSLGRRVGLMSRVDKAGFPMDPLFLHPEDRLPVTEPGDRYPTTGLTPPSGLSIELNRSYFSDDSSDSGRRNMGTLRQRWTRLKSKRPSVPVYRQGDGHADSSYEQDGNGSSIFVESNIDTGNPDILMLYDRAPAGMSKVEFRAKRVYEKLRAYWFKSGEVIRSISKKNKQKETWSAEGGLFAGA